MKISKALKKIMNLFNVTMYRIAKESGLAPPSVSRAVAEPNRDMSLFTLEKIANGLEKIDPLAKPMLYELIKMPDDLYMELEGDYGRVLEDPEMIKRVIDTLVRLGYIDADRIKKDRLSWYKNNKSKGIKLPFELYISVEINNDRIKEETE